MLVNHFCYLFELKANIKNLTDAALNKFVVGNRVVNCEALDTDSPSYKENEEKNKMRRMRKKKQSCMDKIVTRRHHNQKSNQFANFLIRIVNNLWIICKRPFQIFEKKQNSEESNFFRWAQNWVC